jgi:hypothetical protein
MYFVWRSSVNRLKAGQRTGGSLNGRDFETLVFSGGGVDYAGDD